MKNPNPLEKDIEAKVVAYAKSLGCLVYKFTSPSRRSVPDRLFITKKGEVFFAEMKRLGQKPTPSQEVEIDKIKRQGVPVFVVDSVEAGKTMVDAMTRSDVATERGPLLCTVCGEPQFSTTSGVTCPNEHGGAPGREMKMSDF